MGGSVGVRGWAYSQELGWLRGYQLFVLKEICKLRVCCISWWNSWGLQRLSDGVAASYLSAVKELPGVSVGCIYGKPPGL